VVLPHLAHSFDGLQVAHEQLQQRRLAC